MLLTHVLLKCRCPTPSAHKGDKLNQYYLWFHYIDNPPTVRSIVANKNMPRLIRCGTIAFSVEESLRFRTASNTDDNSCENIVKMSQMNKTAPETFQFREPVTEPWKRVISSEANTKHELSDKPIRYCDALSWPMSCMIAESICSEELVEITRSYGKKGIGRYASTRITIFKLLLIGGTVFELRRPHTASSMECADISCEGAAILFVI